MLDIYTYLLLPHGPPYIRACRLHHKRWSCCSAKKLLIGLEIRYDTETLKRYSI